MKSATQIKIKATYMRGGTSKGLFFRLDDLPKVAQQAGKKRDALLLRAIGSPDPYGKQIDGMGCASSSTSKTVIISKSKKKGYDIDYLFGQVAIDKPFLDWSGNCGNLSSAVAPFAIKSGLIDEGLLKKDGLVKIHIWQVNIQKTIVAYVPIKDGKVQEIGDFELDGVTFLAAEIKLEFIEPVDSADKIFPTGNVVDKLEVLGAGVFNATMINAGIPTIFLNADELGYKGTELQKDINSDTKALKIFETIRAYGAIKMGLIDDISEAKMRQHTPKIAFVSKPQNYTSSSGKEISKSDIDLNVRALSMGQLHHAMMGTVAVSIASAYAISGTLVNLVAGKDRCSGITFGHPSGTLKVGADVSKTQDTWKINSVKMSRSARILMDGYIYIPSDTIS